MTIEVIDVGTGYGDGSDLGRDSFVKCNNNFEEIRKDVSKVYEIGAWNMDADASLEVTLTDEFATGSYLPVILGVTIMDDSLPTTQKYYPLNYVATATGGTAMSGSFYMWKGYLVELHRVTGGFFDSASFDAATGNRGYITIKWVYVGE